MIRVTRLDGSELLLNSDLIETVEQTPDSVISLVNGHKLVVRDTVAQLVERIVLFRQGVHLCPLLKETLSAAIVQKPSQVDSALRGS